MSRADAISVVSHLLRRGYTPAQAAAEICMGGTTPEPGYMIRHGKIQSPMFDGEKFGYAELAAEVTAGAVQQDLFSAADSADTDGREASRMTDNERRAYDAGFADALNAFAWWKDGRQYVGSGIITLNWAIDHMRKMAFYRPRVPGEEEP